MKKLTIDDLIPGMITAEDIIAISGQMIIPKGIVLTRNIILKLNSFAIFSVKVEDDIVKETSYITMSESFKTKVQNSPEFIKFRAKYEENVDYFKTTINAIVKKHSSVGIENLISQTLGLLTVNNVTSTGLLDMLINMRDYDDSTYAHCINVALISNVFAGWLNFSPQDRQLATTCGLFHDVGKLAVPAKIIKKPAKLTADEYNIVKGHSLEGARILEGLHIDRQIIDTALLHHEKCDGSGYPFGYTSGMIPRMAKLVTISDIYDAITSRRVYRKPLSPFKAISIFEDEGLQKYDPEFILVFLENIVNSFLNHRVKLSNGLEGDIIYINPVRLSKPTIRLGEDFLDLSKENEVNIEEIV